MKLLIISFLTAFSLTGVGKSSIVATFNTSEGDFKVDLDYYNAPMAVANFIQLAGKEDDVFETAPGVPFLTESETTPHRLYDYRKVSGSPIAQSLALRVSYSPGSATELAHYSITTGTTELGKVSTLLNPDYYADITGEDRIRLSFVSFDPLQYRITLRYPRPWLDARDQRVKNTPMYKNLKIDRVETGKRFYAGSVTRSLLEHPGYHFQDELVRSEGNLSNPFGTPFSSNAYVLAMDTPAPNRNGSRFFITAATEASFNGRYTVLGFVQPTSRVLVSQIAASSTSGDQVPTTDMTIYGISFQRSGLLAESFYVGYHQLFLPGRIEELCMGIQQVGSQFSLVAPSRPSSQVVTFASLDLIDYIGGVIEGHPPAAFGPKLTDISQEAAVLRKLFYKGFATHIPQWPSDMNLKNARFTLYVKQPLNGFRYGGAAGTLTLVFDEQGQSGSYSFNSPIAGGAGTGTFAATYDFSESPYKGVLNFISVTGSLQLEELTLHLDSSRLANSAGVIESTLIRRFDAFKSSPDGNHLSYYGFYQKPQ